MQSYLAPSCGSILYVKNEYQYVYVFKLDHVYYLTS